MADWMSHVFSLAAFQVLLQLSSVWMWPARTYLAMWLEKPSDVKPIEVRMTNPSGLQAPGQYHNII